MTFSRREHSSWKRHFGTLLVALVLGSQLSGCAKAESGEDDSVLSRQLVSLRADNGLFAAVPFDTVAQPVLADSGYGLRALELAGGRRGATPSEGELRRMFAGQLRAEPLWSRVQLAMIRGEAWQPSGSDLRVIAAMQDRSGFFVDPAAPVEARTDLGIRLMSSQAAVQALGGSGLAGIDRVALARWVGTVGDQLSPGQLLCKVRLERSLGLTSRPTLPDPARWVPKAVEQLGTKPTEESLYEVTAQLLLRRELSQPVPAGAGEIRQALVKIRASDLDPQLVLRIVESLAYLGAPANQLAAAVEPLRERSTPDGLIAGKPRIIGSLAATDAVQRIREESGLPTKDRELASTLATLRSETLARGAAVDKGLWLVALDRAGGTVDDADRRRVASALSAAQPRAVTVATVELWVTIRRLLVRLGYPVVDTGGGELAAIATGVDPARRYARNLAIAALGQVPPSFPAIQPAALLDEVRTDIDRGSLKEAEAAYGALAAIGASAPPATMSELKAGLARLRGCPGSDLLYHPGAGERTCDVYSTLSATRLLNRLEVADTPVPSHTTTER
jgi:hypothetical protein